MEILRIIRVFNKFIRATIVERIFIERRFKDSRVYNYLSVPDSCFKSKSRSIVRI